MIYNVGTKQSSKTFALFSNGLHIGSEKEISEIIIDSREKCNSGLFVCIIGERVDGHNYVLDAIKNGAKTILCSRKLDLDDSITQIVVNDTINALGDIASGIRKQINTKILAVTGSVGKTTTKQMIAKVLEKKYKVKCSSGNYNSVIGFPLSFMSLSNNDEYAVMEMGMSALGEISYMSNIAKPNIAIITNIGSSHLEYLKTRENIAKAKLEVLDGMEEGSPLITSGDELLLKDISCAKYISLLNPSANYYISNIRQEIDSILYDATVDGVKYENIKVKGFGSHIAYDSSLALYAGLLTGIEIDRIKEALTEFEIPGERQKVYQKTINGKKITIISDCYNASPESMKASLNILKEYPSKRKCAILGDMLELGEKESLMHEEIGQYAKTIGVDLLYAIGKISENMAKGYGNCYYYSSPNDLSNFMADFIENIQNGDVYLIKASHSIGLERIITLIEDMEKKNA